MSTRIRPADIQAVIAADARQLIVRHPTKAGIQGWTRKASGAKNWAPACAGATNVLRFAGSEIRRRATRKPLAPGSENARKRSLHRRDHPFAEPFRHQQSKPARRFRRDNRAAGANDLEAHTLE